MSSGCRHWMRKAIGSRTLSSASSSDERWSGLKRFWFRLNNPDESTILGRWTSYWVTVVRDYVDVSKDVVKQIREKPWKGVVFASVTGFSVYSFKHNPDLLHFRDTLIARTHEVSFVAPAGRNPSSFEHLNFVEQCINEGILRRFSFGLFSILWRDNYNRFVGLYNAQCPYLKPEFLSFHQRIIDVGFFDKWWILEKKMIDFDVNPSEWDVSIK